MKSTMTRFICRILAASMIVLPWQAQAGMIATDQALGAAQSKVAGFLQRAEVAAQLERLGLSPQLAQERVAALTDAQVVEIAGRIDALPAGAAPACEAGAGMTSGDLETLRELNRNYIRAAAESDVRWYADNLAEDYRATNHDNSFVGRAGFLARFAVPAPEKDYESVDVKIRILGDVALIHSGFLDRRPDGTVGKGRYTDIYARRDGRWRCVCAHFVRY